MNIYEREIKNTKNILKEDDNSEGNTNNKKVSTRLEVDLQSSDSNIKVRSSRSKSFPLFLSVLKNEQRIAQDKMCLKTTSQTVLVPV